MNALQVFPDVARTVAVTYHSGATQGSTFLFSARDAQVGPAQTFVRVELPLAVPAVVAGLRIATVSTISIATVAALVLPKGLGHPIFIALQQDIFKTEILAAGAHGYLLRSELAGELAPAIEALARHRPYLTWNATRIVHWPPRVAVTSPQFAIVEQEVLDALRDAHPST